MTKRQREKAVLIAKDALKWIKKPGVQVKAENGYCQVMAKEDDEDGNTFLESKYAGQQLKEVASKVITKKTPCEVCALGGLFLAHVGLFNKFKVPSYFQLDKEDIVAQLKTTFSEAQMNLIEDCFEKNYEDIYDYDEGEYFANPFYEIEDDTERLRAILKAIIKGNGELILEKVANA